MSLQLVIEGEICVENDTVYCHSLKRNQEYNISSIFNLSEKRGIWVGLELPGNRLFYKQVSASELSLMKSDSISTIKSTIQPPSFRDDTTKFSNLSDRALMILVKKKNKDALQEFKNRKLHK